MNCRHCSSPVTAPFVDLGSAPPSNAYLTKEELKAPERWFPLRVLVCETCWLVQTEDFALADDLFDAEYAYFSSFSPTWLEHSRRYVEGMIKRFHLNAESHVVEVAANDGYLLQYVKQAGIPCTGIEPTASTAAAARSKGIHVIEKFFGADLASSLVAEGGQADLIASNNVLAHVPDINDFARGIAMLLKETGVATFEFPHLLQLVKNGQFDTVYHEHFSYLSLTSTARIFARAGLTVFDVEELPTHGGSLRVYTERADGARHEITSRVQQLGDSERAAGLSSLSYYSEFQERADSIKNEFVMFLLEQKRLGKTVAAYGAAAKGNTLLNYAGIRGDLLSFVVDRNPAKQGKYLPGSRIPVVGEEMLKKTKPDFIVILPWNLREEVIEQLSGTRNWDAKFVTAVPRLEIT